MIIEFTELKVPEETVIKKDQRIRFKVELTNMLFFYKNLGELRCLSLNKKELKDS